MSRKIRKIAVAVVAVVWALLTLFAWLQPAQEISLWERRPLKQMPELSVKALISGDYAKAVESAAVDQFPLRNTFRTIKSVFSYYVLNQKDNNGIYLEDGYAAKLEYPLNGASVSHALGRFQYLRDTYLQDSKVVMAVVPDKGYYLAQEYGYPVMDYEKLMDSIQQGMPWAEHVDLTPLLSIQDYYRTDTHWRQENLQPVAQCLADALGVGTLQEYEQVLLDTPFYGVYYGQAALPMEADPLVILENELLADCRVYNHETGTYQPVYDLERATGQDPYDVFLSGAQALLTIENPNAPEGKELIVFRDSFGSSIAPLLVSDYSKVTLVDLRYIRSDMLGEFLDFHGQDVLMLYSTLILNSSLSMK